MLSVLSLVKHNEKINYFIEWVLSKIWPSFLKYLIGSIRKTRKLRIIVYRRDSREGNRARQRKRNREKSRNYLGKRRFPPELIWL